MLLYCVGLESLGHILLNCRRVLLHKISKSEMIQNGLMELSVKHLHEFRVSSQLLQLRCFFQSVLVSYKVHQVHFCQFAQSIAVENIDVFLQVSVDGRQLQGELPQYLSNDSFSRTKRHQTPDNYMEGLTDLKFVHERRNKILSDNCNNQVNLKVI